MSETNDEYTARIVREQMQWLDELAENHGEDIAKSIAETNRNSLGEWGAKWIEKRGLANPSPTDVAKRQENAFVAFNKAQAEYEKANGIPSGRGINKFIATETGRALYAEYDATLKARGRHE